MEQRRLRLGDILDDYCPRERRVTNHAVVAMIEEDVKQTRCTTCDAEHVYKGGKAPRRRKKDAGSALYEEVLAGIPEAAEATPVARPTPAPVPDVPAQPPVEATPVVDETIEDPVAGEEPEPEPEPEPVTPVDDGPFHRRLIRATLPRPEGQKEVRQVPDFTIRQNGGRGGNAFRSGSRMRGPGGPGGGRGPAGPGGPGRGPGGGGRPRRFGGGSGPGGPGGPSGGAGRNGRPFGNRGRKK